MKDLDSFDDTFFENPLSDWNNPDLLVDRELQKRIEDYDKDVFDVVHWPELVAAFSKHDENARDGKLRSRKLGLIAVILGGAGSAIVILSSALLSPFSTLAVFVGLIMVVLGFGVAIVHITAPKGHKSWLSERLRAERLRAGYFQFLLAHFHEAVDAIAFPEKREEFREKRQLVLDHMLEKLTQQSKGMWKSWIEDGDLQEVWLTEKTPPDLSVMQKQAVIATKTSSHEATKLIERIYQQRMLIQSYFHARANAPTFHTASGRAKILKIVTVSSMICVPLFSFLAALSLFSGQNPNNSIFLMLVSIAATFGFTAKIIDQGVQINADHQRYNDYARRVEATKDRFEDGARSGDIEDQIRSFFELEKHAYWETRQFYIDHHNNSFLEM